MGPMSQKWMKIERISIFEIDFIYFLPKGKGIWNNTGETRQSFGRCFPNFMGIPKNNLPEGDVYFLEGGLWAPYDFLHFLNIIN